jgi:hypothetical protein
MSTLGDELHSPLVTYSVWEFSLAWYALMQLNKDVSNSLHYWTVLCLSLLKQAITWWSHMRDSSLLVKIMHLADSILAFWAFLGKWSSRTTR